MADHKATSRSEQRLNACPSVFYALLQIVTELHRRLPFDKFGVTALQNAGTSLTKGLQNLWSMLASQAHTKNRADKIFTQLHGSSPLAQNTINRIGDVFAWLTMFYAMDSSGSVLDCLHLFPDLQGEDRRDLLNTARWHQVLGDACKPVSEIGTVPANSPEVASRLRELGLSDATNDPSQMIVTAAGASMKALAGDLIVLLGDLAQACHLQTKGEQLKQIIRAGNEQIDLAGKIINAGEGLFKDAPNFYADAFAQLGEPVIAGALQQVAAI